ncbi:hypothetical protein KI387_041970, partial [Taxus chinensis]
MNFQPSEKEVGENEEQPGEASGHMEQTATSVPPRMYECVFCKGGFSSAQALGGHMNVHRSERARLRRSLSSTLSAPYDLREHQPATKHDQGPSSSSLASKSATKSSRKKH